MRMRRIVKIKVKIHHKNDKHKLLWTKGKKRIHRAKKRETHEPKEKCQKVLQFTVNELVKDTPQFILNRKWKREKDGQKPSRNQKKEKLVTKNSIHIYSSTAKLSPSLEKTDLWFMSWENRRTAYAQCYILA